MSILFDWRHTSGGILLKVLHDGKPLEETLLPNEAILNKVLALQAKVLEAAGFFRADHGNPSGIREFVRAT